MQMKARRLAALLVTLGLVGSTTHARSSFLKDGDRWLFVGDSITHTDTYRQVLLRVLQHFHPDADIMVGNSAVSGVKSDYEAEREFTPTIVTVMLGMNDVIHQDWSFSPDPSAKTAAYRKSITAKVRQYKELGAQVVLMTPTYTDERAPAYFNVAMTRRFLEAFGGVVREIAQKEACHWVPVAEELEAYQDTLGIARGVRPDGVHPYGLGQYQIARTLWQRLALTDPLEGERRIAERPKPVEIKATLDQRFMHTAADGVTVMLSSETPTKVEATWSLGSARGTAELTLGPEPLAWRLPVPPGELEVPIESFKRLVFDLATGDRRGVWVLDLARTRVLKMKDGSLSGALTTDGDRREGAAIGTWTIREHENELWFSGEVNDSEIHWVPGWPFMRDGVALWLDLRPADRCGDINIDHDVFQVMVNVRETPAFSATLVPWIGPRMAYSGVCGGAKTPTGYQWHLAVAGNFAGYKRFDVRKLDYFGVNIGICDTDLTPKPSTRHVFAQQFSAPDQARRINLLMIVDRKGVFPGDETTNLHLFGP